MLSAGSAGIIGEVEMIGSADMRVRHHGAMGEKGIQRPACNECFMKPSTNDCSSSIKGIAMILRYHVAVDGIAGRTNRSPP